MLYFFLLKALVIEEEVKCYICLNTNAMKHMQNITCHAS